MRALALIGLDVRAKHFADRPVGPYAPAYLLQDLSNDPLEALEQAFRWSNGEDPGCRGRAARNDPPAYNGPSLSVGDVVALMRDADGDVLWHRCANVGFEPCAVPHVLEQGSYLIPHATMTRVIAPGSSWAEWMPLMEQLNTERS